ncbi:MAG: beta-propeller fold lactonase family protein, partial [Candidatus Angelobacter sp.]
LDLHDQFLYTANEGSGDISAYSISSGALTQVTGSPFSSLPAGSTATAQPVFVTVDPSNLFVYVGNQSSNTISGLNLNPADGTLTQIVNSPFGGVGASWLIAIR